MKSLDVAALIRSKWFGAIGYALILVLGLILAYRWWFPGGETSLQMNMSCFAFRDINRNGVYDMADRPYAGLKVTMDRPKGEDVTAFSNLSGFANFQMKYRSGSAVIVEPGEHTITIEPPDGWIITTGNSVQTTVFRRNVDAPMGMGADRTYRHVGVAPELTISGKVEASDAGGFEWIERFTGAGPGGTITDIEIADTGFYSLDATPGKWMLRMEGKGGESVSREIQVHSNAVVLSLIGPSRGDTPRPSETSVIGFDDLTTSDTLLEVPNGYYGLDWNNWVATHHKFYGKESQVNATVSREYLAYTSSGHPSLIESSRPFDLVGVFVTMDEPRGEDFDVVFKAWQGDALTYEDRLRASVKGPVYFDSDYRGVTRIEVSNEANWHVVVDDLKVRLN